MTDDKFDVMAKEIKLLTEANLRLRAALLPFAAAAGRPRMLTDYAGKPLPNGRIIALGVKVSAWKQAIELTGANLEPPDEAFRSPEDRRWER